VLSDGKVMFHSKSAVYSPRGACLFSEVSKGEIISWSINLVTNFVSNSGEC